MRRSLLALLLIMGMTQVNAQTSLFITCPPNFQDTVMNACSKLIKVPNPTYNTSDKTSTITWTMTGLTVAASPDTGQNFVGTRRFNTGGTLIKYIIRKNNDSATCSFGFALREFIPPTITCPSGFTGYTTAQACSRAISIPSPVISDNCKILLFSWKMTGATNDTSKTLGIYFVGNKTFNKGVTNVSYLVTDASGNTARCSFKVTILDTLKPILKCPGNITEYANDSCKKRLTIAKPLVSDACGLSLVKWKAEGATTAASPLTGINFIGTKTFNIGQTTVTYTAKDSSGNTATCSFIITIRDTTRPVITNCKDSIGVSVTDSCSKIINLPPISFFDNCQGARLTWVMSGVTTGSGAGQIGMASFNVGVTIVSYTVTDGSGNTATCKLKVTVKDEQKPIIQCPSSISDTIRNNDCSKSITLPNPLFSDNCAKGLSLTWKMTGATVAASPATGVNFIGTSTFNTGITTCVYTVRDAVGNATSCSFTVSLVELTSPVIGCPADKLIDSVAKCSRPVTINPPTFSDNCGVVKLVWKMSGATSMSSPITGINLVGTKTFNRGTTLITYTARDASGNAATCTQRVILTGPEPCQNFAKDYVIGEQQSQPVRFRLLNNPAHQYFTLTLESLSNTPAEINIYSAEGRKIEQLRTKAGQPITFGLNYTKGTYLVEVKQGLERKTLTAIKQ